MKVRVLRALMVACLLCGVSSFAHAQKTIKVNFDSTNAFEESCGTKGTAKASGLTADQKKKILEKAQQKYDDALGKNKVMVMEGSGGDVDVIVSGDQAPGTLKGKEYGDAGKPGKPGVVHAGEFTGAGFSGDGLTNAIGECLAHEAGHKLGLSHNWDKGKLMAEGSKVSKADREADNRPFTDDDKKVLMKSVCPPAPAKAEHKHTIFKTDLVITVGEKILPQDSERPDDRYLDASAIFQGPLGLEWGYMSFTNEFVFQGDTDTSLDDPFMTFLYNAGIDLAVRDGDMLFSLSSGAGSFALSNPNPDGPGLFQTANLFFETGRGTAQLTFNATIDRTTGGFSAVPEPAALALLLTGAGSLLSRRRRRWTRTTPAV